ncbi:recombinase family protein [Streptosporangium sp. V21-05]|uniref:recombinase family protein n=1 Tax=Streptosporangium sp. V21-05 TaxID=3446115 RepID=UPI003F533F16
MSGGRSGTDRPGTDNGSGAARDERLAARLDRMVASWAARLKTADPGRDLAEGERIGARLVVPGDPEWPTQLDDLGDSRPYGLWLHGDADLRFSCLRSVAVVGSRAATPYGTHVAAELGAGLSERGWGVVSGGASIWGMTTPRMRCVLYLRISDDRTGAGLGVQRQEGDLRGLAAKLDWDVVGVYIDNDLSAYSGKPRPDYQRMLVDLQAGIAGAVLAWHNDRLHRLPAELEEYINVCDPRGIITQTFKAGSLDLSTPSGRMVARQLGAVARFESEHKADRIKAKHLQLAKDGKSTGGGFRPYGYRRIYDHPDPPHRLLREELIPEEAEIIRECVRRVLAGEALAAVCRDLNRRGVPTSSTGIWTARQVASAAEVGGGEVAEEIRARLAAEEPASAIARDLMGRDVPLPVPGGWSTPTLARMLTSARIAGLREHRPRSRHQTKRVRTGEIMGVGEWPAIITPAESARLRVMLADPARRVSPGPTGKYLLTGLIYCDLCKHRMVGRSKSGGRKHYMCDGQPGRPGCGRVSARAEYVDAVIGAAAAQFLTAPGFAEALAVADEAADEGAAVAEIAACEQELLDLAADHGAGVISRAEWMAARKPLQGRIEAARSSLGRVDVVRVLEGLPDTPEGVEAFLLDGEVEASRRRSVLAVALERVLVRPVIVRGSKRFDPARLAPVWRF